jgi:hypothetical protein
VLLNNTLKKNLLGNWIEGQGSALEAEAYQLDGEAKEVSI